MGGKRRVRTGLCILSLVLMPAGAFAGPLFHKDCPKQEYCCLHYWTPTAVRLYEQCFSPRIGMYAVTHGAQIQLDNQPIYYRCPTADAREVPYAPGLPSPGAGRGSEK